MAQWERIHLPMQEDTDSIPDPGRFHKLRSNWAYKSQLLSLCSQAQGRSYWASMLPQLKPTRPRSCAPKSDRAPRWEVHTPQLKSSPCSSQLEKKTLVVSKTQHSQKYIYIYFFFLDVLSLFFIFTFLNTYKIEKVENSIAEKSPFLSPPAPRTPVPLPPLRGDSYHF